MSVGSTSPLRRALCSGSAATLVAVALAACGGSSSPAAKGSGKPTANGTLNTPRVALAIENSILSERHIHAKVVCPPNVPQEKGLTFTCVATTSASKGHHPIRTMFTVSQTDSNGHVYYASPK
jgi:hypothetical protein